MAVGQELQAYGSWDKKEEAMKRTSVARLRALERAQEKAIAKAKVKKVHKPDNRPIGPAKNGGNQPRNFKQWEDWKGWRA